MSAPIAKWPIYTTSMDVDIDPDDLAEAGWIYIGKGGADDPEDADAILAALESWHNETHAGVFRFCDEHPCHDVGQALRAV